MDVAAASAAAVRRAAFAEVNEIGDDAAFWLDPDAKTVFVSRVFARLNSGGAHKWDANDAESRRAAREVATDMVKRYKSTRASDEAMDRAAAAHAREQSANPDLMCELFDPDDENRLVARGVYQVCVFVKFR